MNLPKQPDVFPTPSENKNSSTRLTSEGSKTINVPRPLGVILLILIIFGTFGIGFWLYTSLSELLSSDPLKLVIGIFSFAVFLLTFFLLLTVWRLLRAQSWGTASGVIVKSEVYVTQGRKIRQIPWIIYQYQVGGKIYEQTTRKTRFYNNSVVAVGGDPRSAKKIVAQFPTGKQVPVYYNPANPADSALLRSNSSLILLHLFSIFFIVLVIAVFIGLRWFGIWS